MHYQTYSQRVLCPCHGMLQVVRVEGGVAESIDGFSWKLFVADESIISHTGLSEVRYGDWNPRAGCSRSRIRGTSTAAIIEVTGEKLIAALTESAHRVPFPPLDRFEYWLADETTHQPLALLESRTQPHQFMPVDSPHWHPGAAAINHFTSAFGDARSLANLIHKRAGRKPSGFWVERTASGTGRKLDGGELDDTHFPELYLSSDWPEPTQAHLVNDFLAWQAPWLLQIHNISQATRLWLEQAAWRRPRETCKVYRLFPEVHDQAGLTVARVKARIIGEKSDEVPLEPFYPFYNE